MKFNLLGRFKTTTAWTVLNRICIAVIIAILTVSVPAHAKPDVEKLSEGTVRVITHVPGGYGKGTGFVVNNNGYIMTNAHVVSGGNKFEILTNGSTIRVPATLIATDENRDLAILKAESLTARPVVFSTATPKLNDDVLALGYPANADSNDASSWSTTPTPGNGEFTRIFQGTWNKRDFIKLVQHGAPINPGNSGGPLFDYCGRVLGVNTQGSKSRVAKDRNGNVVVVAGTGIFFASHISESMKLLDSNNIRYRTEGSACNVSEAGISKFTWAVIIGLILAIGMLALFFASRPAVNKITVNLPGRDDDSGPFSGGGSASSVSAYNLIGADGYLAKISLSNKRLRSGGLSVGMIGKGADILLNDDTVSGNHARLTVDGSGGLFIRDEQSTNGTRINGKKIGSSPVKLKAGDKVQFGAYALSVTTT